MLTIRTSAHIPTNRQRNSFRLCPASTGVPLVRVETSRLLQEWIRLLDAESRRLWLDIRWRSHLHRVRSTPGRRP